MGPRLRYAALEGAAKYQERKIREHRHHLKSSIFMASRNQGSTPRALVVEDTKVDRVILMHILHKLNCETIAVENGKEAVDLFLEGKTFDIVFTDKDMPIMSGPEAVAKIRAMGATEVKIIGVSADFGGREAFMQAGADVFVPKPVKHETVESMLKLVISKKNMSG